MDLNGYEAVFVTVPGRRPPEGHQSPLPGRRLRDTAAASRNEPSAAASFLPLNDAARTATREQLIPTLEEHLRQGHRSRLPPSPTTGVPSARTTLRRLSWRSAFLTGTGPPPPATPRPRRCAGSSSASAPANEYTYKEAEVPEDYVRDLSDALKISFFNGIRIAASSCSRSTSSVFAPHVTPSWNPTSARSTRHLRRRLFSRRTPPPGSRTQPRTACPRR